MDFKIVKIEADEIPQTAARTGTGKYANLIRQFYQSGGRQARLDGKWPKETPTSKMYATVNQIRKAAKTLDLPVEVIFRSGQIFLKLDEEKAAQVKAEKKAKKGKKGKGGKRGRPKKETTPVVEETTTEEETEVEPEEEVTGPEEEEEEADEEEAEDEEEEDEEE